MVYIEANREKYGFKLIKQQNQKEISKAFSCVTTTKKYMLLGFRYLSINNQMAPVNSWKNLNKKMANTVLNVFIRLCIDTSWTNWFLVYYLYTFI